MQGSGVIVKYSQLVDGTNEELSCSGMYLGHGTVLTHGTLLVDLFRDKKAQPIIDELSTRGYCAGRGQQASFLNSILKEVKGEFQVILPSKEHVREVVGIEYDPCSSSGIESHPLTHTSLQSLNKCFVPHTQSGDFLSAATRVDRIILQPGVYECLHSLMPASQGWKLLEEKQSGIPPHLEKLIMSTFVLLMLSEKYQIDEDSDNSVIEATKEIMSLLVPIHKGNFVYIESSPFGSISPSLFLNSLSHGIICNTGPKGEEVLLTDARCITGAEGAPVFVIQSGQRRPCALVISPFCWRGGEWLGLTLLASLSQVLHTLLHSYTSLSLPLPKNLSVQSKNHHHPTSSTTTTTPIDPQSKNAVTDKNFMEGALKDVSRSVVCIKCGKGWGSGVVISTSPGIILTCAHVVYKATNKEVSILLSDGRWTQGTVIHQTRPLITWRQDSRRLPQAQHSMWDLAVVATFSPLPHALPLATTLPTQGVSVVVAGYGMFPSRILSTASLSRGVISKVVTLASTSIHLPPSLANVAYNERKTDARSDNDISPRLNTSARTRHTTTSQHDLSIKRDWKSGGGDSSHCLVNLDNLTSGTLSKCGSVPVPVILQTTCAVYAGGSGGPVVTVHPSHGVQVVGVVVCNMQDSNSVTFPHVNLAVPVPSIATILHTFLKTRNKTVLQYLDLECSAASHLWGMTHPSQSSL